METYDGLIKNGYDRKFDTYADAVVNGGTKAVRDWMYANGDTYFTCTITESVECCKTAWTDNMRKRCDDAHCGGWNDNCPGNDPNNPNLSCWTTRGWINVTEPCPPDQSQRNYEYVYWRGGLFPSTYWSLRAEKEADFWAELLKATGIKKDDIQFQSLQSYSDCTTGGGDEENRCRNQGWDYNFPVPHGFEKSDVANPKQVVSDAYTNLRDIVRDLPTAAAQLRSGTYAGVASDLADAVALPVFMIEEAVGGIKSISDAIDEADREKQKNFILLFLTSIFFFVPIVGQLVGSIAALANIGRVIAILGAAGEIAIDIYNVVDTKGNDPLAIFSLVLSPIAIFDVGKVGRAAAISRGMKNEDIGKLGKGVSDKMDLYRGVAGKHRACLVKKNKRSVEVEVFPEGGMPMSGLNGEPVWSGGF